MDGEDRVPRRNLGLQSLRPSWGSKQLGVSWGQAGNANPELPRGSCNDSTSVRASRLPGQGTLLFLPSTHHDTCDPVSLSERHKIRALWKMLLHLQSLKICLKASRRMRKGIIAWLLASSMHLKDWYLNLSSSHLALSSPFPCSPCPRPKAPKLAQSHKKVVPRSGYSPSRRPVHASEQWCRDAPDRGDESTGTPGRRREYGLGNSCIVHTC